MKKSLLIGALMLGAASFSMLTGFDSAMTAEDVLNKSQEVSKSMNEISADAKVAIDLTADITSPMMTMNVSALIGADYSIASTLDPFAMCVDGVMTGSVTVGGETEDMSTAVTEYMIAEDDGMTMYAKFSTDPSDPAGTWSKIKSPAGNMKEMIEKLRNMNFDYASLPFSYELADAPVTVNGRECYHLTATATIEEILLLAQPYLEEMGDTAGMSADELFAFGSLLSGLQFVYEADVDAETFDMIAFRMTTEGTDWNYIASNLASMLSTGEDENAASINLDVRQFEISGTYNPDASVSIIVPEEALAAQELDENGLSGSLLDLVENAE